MEESSFHQSLIEAVAGYGIGNQEGIKEILQQTQQTDGCISQAKQEAMAKAFEVPTTIVSTLIRFNKNLTTSPLAHDIICCSGPRCAKRGSVDVLKNISQGLNLNFGETSKDGRIRLRTQNCFKECQHGPNVMVNGQFHHEMNGEKAMDLVKDILK